MKKILMVVAIVFVAVLLIGNKTDKEPTEWSEYAVFSGDTVDGISNIITPNDRDYRKTKHYIIEKNNLENAMVYPGQTILVPVYE